MTNNNTSNTFNVSSSLSSNIFGQASPYTVSGEQTTGNMFSAKISAAASSGNILGNQSSLSSLSTNIFGGQKVSSMSSTNIFGNQKLLTSSASIFGNPTTSTQSGSIFGNPTMSTSSANIFGNPTTSASSANIFGNPTMSASSASIFGNPTTSTPSASIFGNPTISTSSANIFGNPTTSASSANIFGNPTKSTSSANTFGNPTMPAPSASIFGNPTMSASSSNIFGNPTMSASSVGIPPNIFGSQPSFNNAFSSQSSPSNLFGSQPSLNRNILDNQPPPNLVFHSQDMSSNNISSRSSSPGVFNKAAISANTFGSQTVTVTLNSNISSIDEVSVQSQPKTMFSSHTLFSNVLNDQMFPNTLQNQSRSFGVDKSFVNSQLSTNTVTSAGATKNNVNSKFSESSVSFSGNTNELVQVTSVSSDVSFPATNKVIFSDVRASTSNQQQETMKKRPISSTFFKLPREEEPSHDEHGIVCQNVPPNYNNQTFLKKHFSQFGIVSKININALKRKAIIFFKSRSSAEKAKTAGRTIKVGLPPLQIIWLDAPKLRRMSSAEETEESVAIKCLQIPPNISKEDLRSHFSQYGKVAKVFMYPENSTSVIHFLSHEAAINAKKNGAVIDPKYPPLEIFITKYKRSNKLLEKESESVESSSFEKKLKTDETESHTDLQSSKTNLSKTQQSFGIKRKAIETTKSMTNIPKTVVSGDVSLQIRSLLESSSHTPTDRYAILEKRDKLIKASRTSGKLIGTCTDMCPEKERYMREDRRQLSIYEIIPGTDIGGQNPRVDHNRAVKEYSRSSADQEMPLAHEMRPGPVLQYTMDYLLLNIADLGCEGQWADWYEYMWNRTRAIRKDITQLRLNDLTAVDLLERCARFHIYCSHRLCEEDVAVFDEKINNKNLTNCLQSLKELYDDLWTNHGIQSPNEAEFRAYVVLMNLNEGEILREVQELRPGLSESEPVRFVMKVYSTKNSNNYIRFFKLVQQASFLNACLLHRYFTQIRHRALNVLLRSYLKTYYPLSRFTQQLAFESDDEAGNFCQHYGLEVTDGSFMCDKTLYVEPAQAVAKIRAKRLIESKQIRPISEIINGRPLPENFIREASSSFDDHGFLIKERVTALFVTEEPITEAGDEQETIKSRKLEEDSILSLDGIKQTAKELAKEVVDKMCVEIVESAVKEYAVDKTSVELTLFTISDCLSGMMREIAEEVLNESQQEVAEKLARERAERAIMLHKLAESFCADVLDGGINEMCREESALYLRNELDTLCYEQISNDTWSRLMDLVILDMAKAEHTLCVEQHAVLQNRERDFCVFTIRRFWGKWKNQLADQRRKKSSILTFPPTPSLLPTSVQLSHLLPLANERTRDDRTIHTMHLGHNAWLTIDTPPQVIKKSHLLNKTIDCLKELQQLEKKRAWEPVDLVALMTRAAEKLHQISHSSDTHYWKGVIMLPQNWYYSQNQQNSAPKWLKQKFSRGATLVAEIPGKTESWCAYTGMGKNKYIKRVAVCTRIVYGQATEQVHRSGCLKGTSGILFVLDDRNNFRTEAEFWQEEVTRLKSIIQLFPINSTPLPLAIVSVTADNNDTCMALDYKTAQFHLQVSSYTDRLTSSSLFQISNVNSAAANDELCDMLFWLMNNQSHMPSITSRLLVDYVEDCLCNQYYKPLYEFIATCPQKHHLSLKVNGLIENFNNLVSHMAAMSSHQDLQYISWPVSEFCGSEPELPGVDWNAEETLSMLSDMLLELKLPLFDNDTVQRDVDTRITYYIDLVTMHDKPIDCIILKNRIAQCCFQASKKMCWVDVIDACIEHKIRVLTKKCHKLEKMRGYPLHVHYLPQLLESCQFECNFAQLTDELEKHKDEVTSALTPPKNCYATENAKYTESPLRSQTSLAANILHTLPSFDKFSHILEDEKTKSYKFEDYLRSAVDLCHQLPDLDIDNLTTDCQAFHRISYDNSVNSSTCSLSSQHRHHVPRAYRTESETLQNKSRDFCKFSENYNLNDSLTSLEESVSWAKLENMAFEKRLDFLLNDSTLDNMINP